MEMNQPSNRMHPLIAGAAVSVMLVSLLGAAAITGILPNSQGTAAERARIAAQSAVVAPVPAPTQQVATAPVAVREVVAHKTVVHHRYDQRQAESESTHARPVQVAQAEPAREYSPAPVYQQPAPVAQNSPVGIGLGAVVGGLLGNQVGGGRGRTLATIAGAVGGGYAGNEIAKRNY